MATLVHDDVLDGADAAPRAATVVHALTAPDVAVSAGNYLLARAFSELAGAGDAVAVDMLSAAAVGLSRGRGACSATRPTTWPSARSSTCAAARARRPTCSPRPAGSGARLSGGGDEDRRRGAGRVRPAHRPRLPGARRHPGFQRRRGRARASAAGTDVRDGTITLPLIFALAVAARPGARCWPPRRPARDEVAVAAADAPRAASGSGALPRARRRRFAVHRSRPGRSSRAAPDTVERGAARRGRGAGRGPL